jgi:hypothetical protein
MNQIKLYGKPIRVNKASYDTKKPVDVGANLFIGSLDEGVDENALFDRRQTRIPWSVPLTDPSQSAISTWPQKWQATNNAS